jgi:hypothetical protein
MTARSDKRKVARTIKRSERARARAVRKRARDQAQEERDEAVAPLAQRVPVTRMEQQSDGSVREVEVKTARLVRDGVSFRVACPIEYLVKQGRRREANGGAATINVRHLAAVKVLSKAWELSQTITAGVSGYDQKISGVPQTGYLSEAQLKRIRAQQRAAREVGACRIRLGGLWTVVEAIGLRGQTVTAWAKDHKMDPEAAVGYLRAGLDLLVEHAASQNGR